MKKLNASDVAVGDTLSYMCNPFDVEIAGKVKKVGEDFVEVGSFPFRVRLRVGAEFHLLEVSK